MIYINKIISAYLLGLVCTHLFITWNTFDFTSQLYFCPLGTNIKLCTWPLVSVIVKMAENKAKSFILMSHVVPGTNVNIVWFAQIHFRTNPRASHKIRIRPKLWYVVMVVTTFITNIYGKLPTVSETEYINRQWTNKVLDFL